MSELAPDRATILVVDDKPENLRVVGDLLRDTYQVRVANSGARALAVADSAPRPDLILLDVMMPEMDGYEVMRRLRANPATADIPVIFVTALNADEDEEHGLALGAVDYVTKPLKPAILLARVRSQLELKHARDRLRDQNDWLEAEIARRMRTNELIKDVTLYGLAALAEVRDNETGNHLHRTRAYIETLMAHLCEHPDYAAALTPEARQIIAKAAPLHDIGKVGIPDHILLKPGKLTPDEFEIMKTHARIGGDAIMDAVKRVVGERVEHADLPAPEDFTFLEVARDIATHHHERWDGSGYPDGLRGDAIPLAARLMAVADVFDALTCRRPYKAPWPLEKAVALIVDGRGSHFDPQLVDAFLDLKDRFAEIAVRYADDA